MIYSAELLEHIKPGAKVRYIFGSATERPQPQLWHIRAVVDDEYVACKLWTGKRWYYFVEDMIAFQLAYNAGNLELI